MVVQPTAAELRRSSGVYPPEISLIDLQLPPLDKRIPALARQITVNAHTEFDKAAAVEHYLRTSFGYTLEMSTRHPEDPLADFLFRRKEGHCEYFASAMAVMMRSLGVPARIVNGFRTGEYNPVTGNYIIRARDAHSWVEVYLPAVGWTAFDPTPPDPRYAHGGMSRLMSYLDAAQEFWREWIINYDFSHQRTLTNAATARSQHALWDIGRWSHDTYQRLLECTEQLKQRFSQKPVRWSMFLALTILTLFLIFNAGRALRGIRNLRIAHAPSKSPRLAASVWYERMVRTAAKRGYRKSPAQTPREFSASIRNESLRRSVENFTDAYERARFGESSADAMRLPKIYEELAKK
jgi:hypothetical protein